MMSTDTYSLAFAKVIELCLACGADPLNKYPACWEQQLDKQWWVAVNGHKEPKQCSAGVDVPAFSVYVQFNGWPAGIIDPWGGVIAAGAAANEDTFIEALDAFVKARAG